MNSRRVAELLRQIAELHQELAVAILEEASTNDPPKKPRLPVVPKIVPPVEPPSEIDRERARRQLRRLGYRVKP